MQERPVSRTPQPIVADLMEAWGQRMRQKAPDQLLGREGHGFPPMELGVLITKTDLTIVDGENPVVRHGDAVDVSAQVAEHLFRALHCRFAIDDPLGGPDRLTCPRRAGQCPSNRPSRRSRPPIFRIIPRILPLCLKGLGGMAVDKAWGIS
jgi:hypothetical protein